MPQPIALDIPHQLGKDGVRQRLDSRIGSLADKIPGGAKVEHRWEGDTMHFTVNAMGQAVRSTLTIFERHVHAEVDLPGLLQLFAAPIRAAIAAEGPRLLK